MSGYRTQNDIEGLASLLRPEDARRLRAKAWKHLRRIDAAKARALWSKVRGREKFLKAA